MRYRIVIEIDVDNATHSSVINQLAVNAMHECATTVSNPVYLSTEKVEEVKVIRQNRS